MSYFETRLRINFQNFKEAAIYLEFCEKLGIRNLIVEPLSANTPITENIKRKIQTFSDIKIYYRITINPQSLKDFNKEIQKFNNFGNILAVESADKKVQLKASKDSRVDVLSFSNINYIKRISKGVLSLLSQNNTYLELSLSPLLINNQSEQSRNFRIFYRTMETVLNERVKYLLCGDPHTEFDLRNPRSLISICVSLLDIPIQKAKMGFEKYPQELIRDKFIKTDSQKLDKGLKLIGGS
ncbi:MAG: RNase P subunit p30 family protein [Promethearchaeia archaeon]